MSQVVFVVAIFSHHSGDISMRAISAQSEREALGMLYLEFFELPAPPEMTSEKIQEAFFDCYQVLEILEVGVLHAN